jgi:prepilin-type N-terminal cleavage/methylation domain-containing protein
MSKQNKQGFTIIEILIAIVVFVIIGGAAFNLAVSGIGVQRATLAKQEVVDETSFVIEYIGRALRQARKAVDSSCIPDNLNYELVSASELKFIDRDGVCRTISLNGVTSTIEEKIGAAGTSEALTSNNIQVQQLEFIVDGNLETDSKQPRATIVLRAEGLSWPIQTTISKREYDFQP